jgi:hypothetical protein
MRNRILTDREKKMLMQFLDNNESPETFRMLKMRIKKAYPKLMEDYELIKRSVEKF